MFGLHATKPVPMKFEKKNIVIPKEYTKLCTELGIAAPSAARSEGLKDFLIEQQIPIYDENSVHRYMTRMAGQKGKIYVWRALRKKDSDNRWSWGTYLRSGCYRWSLDACLVYPHPVPIHILNDVKIIHDKYPEHAKFFVTDYAVKNPDPFILVTLDGENRYIFGAWDEPGFGVI